MKKTLIVLAIVALAPALGAPAAEAGLFSVGVSFNIGGLFFDLGYGGPRYSAHASHHVYRTRHRVHYRGYQCHSGCYREAGYSYHHESCPVVAYHFRSYGFSPYAAYPGYFAPRSYGYPYRSYGHHYYRYDRRPYKHYYRDDWRYKRRYDHRDWRRYDRRRHDRHYRDHRRHDDRRYDSNRRHRDRRYEDRRRDRRDERRHDGRRRGAASSRSRGN